MDEEFPVSQNPASGGSSQAKSQATKAAKKAARKATIAKGVATKKADKGVVRGAVTVMLMSAGSMLSAKLADAAAEQLRVEFPQR